MKPQPIIENKEREDIIPDENTDIPHVDEEEEGEDPPELYQRGDIIWNRVPGNPWWPALVYGRFSLTGLSFLITSCSI